MATIKKETIGQRGKTAEKAVQELLEIYNTRVAPFAFERLPDARAAGGRIKAQISDFMCWYRRQMDRLCIPLEVKSTEHDFRLPKASLEQLPRLKKSALAGAFPVVLVHFKGLGWRVAEIDFFDFGVPSWDMSALHLYPSPQKALESTGLFPSFAEIL